MLNYLPPTNDENDAMDNLFPTELKNCFDEGAARLGRALAKLEWPNCNKNAPCHEINAIINISASLSRLPNPYDVYAEGTVSRRQRVDLIGFNGETAFVMEAKAFGNINPKSEEVLNDLERMKTFKPELSELAGDAKAQKWWDDDARCRWGIVVISSFRGNDVKDAWLADDDATVATKLGNYRKAADRPRYDNDGTPAGFLKLHKALRNSHRGASEITDGARWNSGEGWLLWGAISIPT